MIQTAITNVMSPTVTAHDPDAFFAKIFSHLQQLIGNRRVYGLQLLTQAGDALALFIKACFIGLVGVDYRFNQFLISFW